jgi:TATA-binding protein-associated factor Taf7
MDSETLKKAGKRLKAIREESYDQETFDHDLDECIEHMLKGELLPDYVVEKVETLWTNKNFSGCADGSAPCCDRRGEWNGFASGPLSFVCPKHCSCHD